MRLATKESKEHKKSLFLILLYCEIDEDPSSDTDHEFSMIRNRLLSKLADGGAGHGASARRPAVYKLLLEFPEAGKLREGLLVGPAGARRAGASEPNASTKATLSCASTVEFRKKSNETIERRRAAFLRPIVQLIHQDGIIQPIQE
jgi:hypothetical protein